MGLNVFQSFLADYVMAEKQYMHRLSYLEEKYAKNIDFQDKLFGNLLEDITLVSGFYLLQLILIFSNLNFLQF